MHVEEAARQAVHVLVRVAAALDDEHLARLGQDDRSRGRAVRLGVGVDLMLDSREKRMHSAGNGHLVSRFAELQQLAVHRCRDVDGIHDDDGSIALAAQVSTDKRKTMGRSATADKHMSAVFHRDGERTELVDRLDNGNAIAL